VNDIQTAIDSRGVKLIFSESYHRRILASTQGIKLPVLDCQPGTYYLFVSARGRIAPCSFTTDEYGVDISQIQTAEAFGKLPLSFSREKAERQALPCQDCPNTNVHGKFS
jgi:radical SAM protein with 4Fe4S-binding SPASM domain